MRAMLLTFILLLSFTEIYAQNYWTRTFGPQGSDVKCLFRTTSGRIFCGTQLGGIYYSNNGGLNWINVPTIPHTATTFTQTQNGYLYSGAGDPGNGNSGIYRSTDGGISWTYLNFSYQINSLLGKINGIVYAANSPFGVFKSTNNGINWVQSSSGIDNNGVKSLEAASNGYIFGGGNGTGKIYRSIDSGASWQVVHTTGQNDMIHKILAPQGDSRIFACVGSKGIYQSTDLGNTWTHFFLNYSEVIDLEIDSSDFYAVTEYRYYYSPNGGINWLEKDPNLEYGSNLKDILITESRQFIGAVSGRKDGIYNFCVDSSNSVILSSDFISSRISLMYSAENGILFACTQTGKIFKSTNQGAFWELKYSNYSFPSNFSMCSDSAGKLYIGGNNGYLVSSNGGNNWTWITNIFYNKRIYGMISPMQGRLIAGTDYGIYVSSNSGSNWVNTWNQSIISLVKGPDGRLYAGKYSPPAVYMSTNLGNNWVDITGSGFNRLNSLCVAPNNALFAATFMGIFVSFNYGQSWANVLPYTEVDGFVINSLNQVYAFSDYYGIYFSQNLNSWNLLNSGLITNNILSMAISPSGYVYAGSSGRGVFKSNYLTSTEPEIKVPAHFSLSQNWPNPFNPSTTIRFDIPPLEGVRGRMVSLIIYDILGREITTLIKENLSPGAYEVSWDGANYPSGAYFYQLTVSSDLKSGQSTKVNIETRKMVLLK